MTQKISSVNIETATLSSFTGPTIANVSIANSTYTILDDTAVSNAGGFVVITGSNFTSGAQVLFGSNSACTVTFVDSTRLNVQVPALTAGSYVVYVQNGDGSTAIRLNGITSSRIPVWSTGSTLAQQVVGAPISISLAATSDSSVTYSVANGSSLPSGTTLAANGLFSGTVTIDNETTYNFTVNAIDAENQDTSRSFSVNVIVGDSFYNITTLHLTGDPTSNTWLSDASTNNFELTPVAVIRPMAFSPYETVWSNFFDGTGDFLTAPTNAALTLNADFTIEFWAFPTASYNNQAIAGTTSSSLRFDSGSFFYLINNGSLMVYVTTAAIFNLNAWTHVAITRVGTTFFIFRNGVSIGLETIGSAGSATFDFSGLDIGRSPHAFGGSFTGYISNFRIVKGTALYTANFTPPTTALTAITNTSILTCQSNRFIDNSTNNFTLTRNGDARVSNFGPFTETDIVTGSALFNSTNASTLTGPNSTNLQLTSAFTAECWVYYTSQTADFPGIFGYHSIGSGAGSGGWLISVNGSTNNVSFLTYANNELGNTTPLVGNIPLRVGSWNHIAVTVNGTTATLYVNGVAAGSATLGAITYTNAIFLAGRWNYSVALRYYNGYISNIRISNSLIYTGNFTPPTSLLTATANTQLLTLQNRIGETNNRFFDISGINSIVTRNGNATQGTFSPFSQTGWSGFFNGSNDPVSLASTASLNIESGNFTIEAWIYMNVMPTGTSTTSWTGDFNSWFVIYELSAGGTTGWQFRVGATLLTLGGTGDLSLAWGTHGMTANRWYHVAVSRSSGTYRLFVDGVSLSLTTQAGSMATSGTYYIGSEDTSGSNFNGYISNLRVIKDQAIYTGNFTPSTTALTNSTIGSTGVNVASSLTGNVALLTCNSARWIDNSNNSNAISRTGVNTRIINFSPFAPTAAYSVTTVGGSGFFDGTGDYLSITDNTDLRLGTALFTIQAWIYRRVAGTAHSIIAKGGASTGFVLQVTSTNVLRFTHATTNIDTTTTIPAGTWTHVAVVREGTGSNQTKIYINGVTSATSTVATDFSQTETMYIGGDRSFSTVMNGFISFLRVNKGVAEYTNNFAVPTVPTVPTPGTVFLLNGTGGGIIDYTGKNNLETVGDARLRSNIVRYGNKSMFFDGTGDRLIVPSSPNFDFGTGNFTIEMWINFTNAAGRTWESIISRAYGVAGGWRFYKSESSNQLRWYHNLTSIVLTSGSTITNNTWSHIAAVRNSGVMTIYIDGISRGSAGDTNNYSPGVYALEIGEGVVTSAFPFQGYIDDLRITRGQARYTANFTPPTRSFLTK